MVFMGLEKPIEYGRQQIFDPTTAKMLLDAQDQYVNAVYNDYLRGLEEMKEFKKEYGNFITPILADQDWYNENVIGKVRNFINDAYSRGIDLTRSAEGRAAISQLINSIDVGSVNKLRSSAANAEEFLKARKQLEAQGLYNPLLAKYDGPDINTYSTLDRLDENGNVVSGSGVWDKMSPTRITDMATFGNPYFEGMKPNVRRESKNGIEYSVEKIDENDLRTIADAHFNELVSTPQGQLMYKYYTDLAGGDFGKAREMFNNAVVDGQRRRIYEKSDYDDNYYKAQNLALQRASQQLARDKFNWDKTMDLLQLGIDENGNPLPSAGGHGGGSGSYGSNNLPTKGTSTMVSSDQDRQYMAVREEFEKDLKDKEAAAFSKLGGDLKLRIGDKARADRYKRASLTLKDPKSSERDKRIAKQTIQKFEQNPSPELRTWIDAYNKSTDSSAWERYSSSIGENTPWGKIQSEETLMNKAREAFYRQNILSSPLDSGAREDMNRVLGIVENPDDGSKVGTVTRGTEFAPVSEADFTGTRSYRHNSKISKLNRLLRGKNYKVTAETESGREYGSGVIDKTKYNIITQKVIFSDSDVVNELDGWSDEEKKRAGIVKSENSYIVPIITRYSTGSYTHANVNSATDERLKGSETVRQRPSRLAESLIKRIK